MSTRAPEPGRARPLLGVAGALVATALDAALLALALGGVPALLGDRRALALLAIWIASSIALALLRPRMRRAGEGAAEPRGVLLALVLIPLAIPPVSAWTGRIGFGRFPGGAPLHWSGVVLAALGLLLRIAAMMRLGARFSPRLALAADHALEQGGLYAKVRHPGYLGALIANLGAALAFASLPGVLLVLGLALVLRTRIAHEERMLEERFGDEYRAYRSRTGALLPRVR